MTLEEVLQELIRCLGNDGDTTLAWEQVREWPKGAVDVFQKIGWIKPTDLSETAECPGCEENCFMAVHVFSARNGQPTRALIACDQRDDMGWVKIPLVRLQQWQLTQGQIARWISSALGLKDKPEKDGVSGIYKLGTIQGKKRLGVLELEIDDSVYLKTSGHSLPLIEAIFVKNRQPVIDRAAILAMIDTPLVSATKTKQNAKKRVRKPESTDQMTGLEIGSPEWRSQTARNAANVRHDQPGGSRDKQQQIREIWAAGGFSSRDICAEEECAALGMSFSSARKALINTPDP